MYQSRIFKFAYGLWFMVYGLWFMVYGLWFMVYGLWFKIKFRNELYHEFMNYSDFLIIHSSFSLLQSVIHLLYHFFFPSSKITSNNMFSGFSCQP